MMSRKFWVILLVTCLLGGSCSKNTDPNIIINIEEEFEVRLWEELQRNTRNFNLLFSTIKKNFNCTNYQIGMDYSQLGNKMRISLNDIIEPIDCLPGESMASGSANFKSLADGIYTLEIVINDQVKNEGLLAITSDYYQLTMDSKDGIVLAEEKLNRVPKGLIWGLIDYKSDNIINAFLEDIQQLSEPILLEDGCYGYFSVENEIITVEENADLKDPISFAFSLTEDSNALEALVKSYEQRYGQELFLLVRTYQGEAF